MVVVVGRRRKIAASVSAALLVATGVIWIATRQGDVDPSILPVEPATEATGYAAGMNAVTTYDLTINGALLVTDETGSPRTIDNVVWSNGTTETYLTLTVRPGIAAAYPTPSGLGPMAEDESFPLGAGRASFSDVKADQTRSITMWWARPDGDVWLLDAYWYGTSPLNTGQATQTLREWALGIKVGSATRDIASFETADPTMSRFAFERSGDLRDRVRVWEYRGQQITLHTIEYSHAEGGLSNLLAKGKPMRVSVAGNDALIVVDGESMDTVIGWQVATPTSGWITLTIPSDLADEVDAIVAALRPLN